MKEEKCVNLCVLHQKCMETESLKGTKYEGIDMCEDGCVWYCELQDDPLKEENK